MVRLTDRPDMTLDVYRGRKTTIQQQQCMYGKVLNPIALRKAKIVYNFGLSQCNRVKLWDKKELNFPFGTNGRFVHIVLPVTDNCPS